MVRVGLLDGGGAEIEERLEHAVNESRAPVGGVAGGEVSAERRLGGGVGAVQKHLDDLAFPARPGGSLPRK